MTTDATMVFGELTATIVASVGHVAPCTPDCHTCYPEGLK